jgi:peptidoglycan hydrolase-like protein with peptidoglycan-binding domain
MRGEDVRWVQRQLIKAGLGYMLAPCYDDGVFGSLTKDAVISFQRSVDITADGIVGPITKDKLNEVGAVQTETGTFATEAR